MGRTALWECDRCGNSQSGVLRPQGWVDVAVCTQGSPEGGDSTLIKLVWCSTCWTVIRVRVPAVPVPPKSLTASWNNAGIELDMEGGAQG